MKDHDDVHPDDEDLVLASRDALVSALLAAGPNQSTLCEGWQTQHLAAHIHLREMSPLAAGLLVRPLSRPLGGKTMALGDRASTPHEFSALVERIATGPPVAARARGSRVLTRLGSTGPARRLSELSNLLEFYVHTEDVRRAQPRWAPRRLSEDYADALFRQLRAVARVHYRKTTHGTTLVRTNGDSIEVNPLKTLVPGARRATSAAGSVGSRTYISGPAGELVMHAFGRTEHALVLVDAA